MLLINGGRSRNAYLLRGRHSAKVRDTARMSPEGYEIIFCMPGGGCPPSFLLLNHQLAPASSQPVMVHVHTQTPNEPSLGAGAHVLLGLVLTPTYSSPSKPTTNTTLALSDNRKDLKCVVRRCRCRCRCLSSVTIDSHVRTLLRKYCTVLFY